MNNIGLCASGKNGYDMVKFAINAGHPIKWVTTCDRDKSDYEGKIASLCKKNGVPCMRKVNANDEKFVAKIKHDKIDIIFLLWWPSIIKMEAIRAARIGWVNLHTSLLPYNRGMHPYYWAIIDDTPYGATLHFIDEGIDTGPILFQQIIPIETTDTGETLYKKLVPASIELFKKYYGTIVRGEFKPKPQSNKLATFHLAKDIEPHSQIDLDKKYKARDLINILRARSFSNGPSAYFINNGRKYYVRVSIEEVK